MEFRFTLSYKPGETPKVIPEITSDSAVENWYIRANQGHSMVTVDKVELVPLTSLANFPVNVVHGTSMQAWTKIKNTGLSRMNRLHIHMAGGRLGEEGIISGMRANSQVYIYIDYTKALEAEIAFFKSANNVILSAGNQDGLIPPELFLKVENADGDVIEM